MRLVFAGTPAVAIPALDALAAARHEILAVVTRLDAPLGRKRVMTPSPVAVRALELGLPVIKANRLDDAVTDRLAGLRPDLGVVVAYGGLVRERLLAVPLHGWINLHFSLLPAWRGAAPVQHALLNGDAETGASVFDLVPELDAGDVYASLSRPIGPTETAGELLAALAEAGAELLTSVVEGIADGTAHPLPQSGPPSSAPKLRLEDARLSWSEPAERVFARIRAMTPEPGAFTTVHGARVKVLEARFAAAAADQPAVLPAVLPAGAIQRVDGRILIGSATEPIELVTVQPAGKKPMPAADWWRGLPAPATAAGITADDPTTDDPAAGVSAAAVSAANDPAAARSTADDREGTR